MIIIYIDMVLLFNRQLRKSYLSKNSCAILLYCKLGTLQPSVLKQRVLLHYVPLRDAM